jgi:SAM-dependent methyltransferase
MVSKIGMSDSHFHRVESSYDQVAAAYVEHIYDELAGKPADRDLLNRFATILRGRGVVCDLGCGPGQVGRYLWDRGVDVIGVDLSPGMLAEARRLNPGIAYRQGNMLALDVPDESWAGIVAFYSIIHIPRPDAVRAMREMARALAPGGALLLAFHVGDDELLETDAWGVPVALSYWFYTADEMAGYLREAGLIVAEIIEREPYGPDVEYPSRRAMLWVTKPGASG